MYALLLVNVELRSINRLQFTTGSPSSTEIKGLSAKWKARLCQAVYRGVAIIRIAGSHIEPCYYPASMIS